MIIQIASLQSFLVCVISAIAVFTAASGIHWVVFVAPRLQKMLDPTNARINITSRVVREKFPIEFERAEREYIQELRTRSTL